MENYELLDFFTPPETGDIAICEICEKQHKRWRSTKVFTIHAGDWEGMQEHLLKVHHMNVGVPE